MTQVNIELQNAITATPQGRQTVARLCKELYNTIEDKAELFPPLRGMLTMAYNDLCCGNFSEPFPCERKKSEYLTYQKMIAEFIPQ